MIFISQRSVNTVVVRSRSLSLVAGTYLPYHPSRPHYSQRWLAFSSLAIAELLARVLNFASLPTIGVQLEHLNNALARPVQPMSFFAECWALGMSLSRPP